MTIETMISTTITIARPIRTATMISPQLSLNLFQPYWMADGPSAGWLPPLTGMPPPGGGGGGGAGGSEGGNWDMVAPIVPRDAGTLTTLVRALADEPRGSTRRHGANAISARRRWVPST